MQNRLYVVGMAIESKCNYKYIHNHIRIYVNWGNPDGVDIIIPHGAPCLICCN